MRPRVIGKIANRVKSEDVIVCLLFISLVIFIIMVGCFLCMLFKLYYLLYNLILKDLVDGLLLLLLGFIIGMLDKDNIPRSRPKLFIASILGWFIVCIFLKMLYYFSPFLISAIYGPEAFAENLKILAKSSPLELEIIKLILSPLFVVPFTLSAIFLLISFILFIYRMILRPVLER